MLTTKQVNEIKEHLAKAQNPIFFYDNDLDGLCSFIILQKFIGIGKGVAIKSFPDLNAKYFQKVEEFNADYIFILDKPVISKGFWDEVEKSNIPVVWLDHHDIEGNVENLPEFVNYYNPTLNPEKSSEPTTALAYQIANKKEDLWIAVMGCISDKYVPIFYSDFIEKYPDLGVKSEDAFDILYKSQIGKIAKILTFSLKDTTTNVVRMQKFLIEAKTPYEIFEENKKNYTIHRRFEFVNQKYQKIFNKAEELIDKKEKLLFFQYGGDLGISSDLSNELSYNYPDKIIAVIYISGGKANISMRGKNAKKILLKAIKNLESARGGGHEDAVGGQIRIEDIEIFRSSLELLTHSN